MSLRRTLPVVVLLLGAAAVVAACSSDDGGNANPYGGASTTVGVTTTASGGAAAPGVGTGTGAGSGGSVTVEGFAFVPPQLDVATGTVTWANQDQVHHTATSGQPGSPDGRFNVDLPNAGSQGQADLQSGTYPYFCEIHNYMRGQITVS